MPRCSSNHRNPVRASRYPLHVDLRSRVYLVGDISVLALDGVIDLSTLPLLQDLLSRQIAESTGEVVVDLDGVAVLDDCGLGVLLGTAGRCRESGRDLVVVCTSERLRHRFAITRLDRALTIRTRVAQR